MASEDAAAKKLHPFFSGPPKKVPASDDILPPPNTAEDISATTPKNDRDEDIALDEPTPKRHQASKPGSRAGIEITSSVEGNGGNAPGTGTGTGTGISLYPLSQTRDSELNIDVPFTSNTNNDLDPLSTSKATNLLKLDLKTGTIGPPPKSAPESSQTNGVQDKRKQPRPRGRPKGAKSLIIAIRYGSDLASRGRIGARINNMLAGEGESAGDSSTGKGNKPSRSSRRRGRPKQALTLRAVSAKQYSTTPPLPPSSTSPTTLANNANSGSAVPTSAKSPQTTHPFFRSHPKDIISSEPKQLPPKPEPLSHQTKSRPPKEFSSTPRPPKLPRPAPSASYAQLGGKCGGTKVPGAKEPAWPWKDAAHIRGDRSDTVALSRYLQELAYTGPHISAKKSKSAVTKVFETESVLAQFEQGLSISSVVNHIQTVDSGDGFAPIPTELRLPTRHFEVGPKLQSRILPQLRTFEGEPADSDDELAFDNNNALQSKTHPVIPHLYRRLVSSLPAFDQYDCETSTWPQKYAPQRAVEVLQAGKEALLLKEWLQKLKIHSVDTGATEGDKRKRRGRPSKEASNEEKKKRKRIKLDGFIVESEDEADEMDEISDPDDDWAAGGSHGQLKTVIRNGDQAAKHKDNVKLTNAVVISGPHGCGKTAAVYAIAKELGFEVREIHSGSRRGGRDVAEMIEAMTQNHIVRQPLDEQDQTDDEVSRDLKSGKQKTMASFFNRAAAAKAPKSTKTPVVPNQADKIEVKRVATQQKQSLILLEEVDILYEQDKQFWPTVIGLITQSKRPFIMTCTDERLVPLQNLNLHGIFRFSPAPPALAVDHMLLVAANEGHVLARGAVESLYEGRNHDLRASLSDLNFWCQIGVGDQRGGLSWYYPRWPKGVDRDRHGAVVRVVSEGTYHEGMGWLCRDSICRADNRMVLEANLLMQTWDGYQVDMGQWQDTLDMEAWADEVTETDTTQSLRRETLGEYEDFTSKMSDADIVACDAFALDNQVAIDAAHPELSAAMRDDFVIGRLLLEAAPTHRYDGLSALMATSIKSLARDMLARRSQPATPDDESAISTIDEANAISHIKTQHLAHIWDPAVARIDMARAFDPIAASEKQLVSQSGSLDPSVFDRTMTLITVEVAPYVRRIVSYDMRLQEERLRRGNLMSEGGRQGKKMRTTRSAYSAMEGGSRHTTRRDKYFGNVLNSALVMKTGGKEWNEAVEQLVADEVNATLSGFGTDGVTSSSESSEMDMGEERGEVVI